jgi:hypothetical protein
LTLIVVSSSSASADGIASSISSSSSAWSSVRAFLVLSSVSSSLDARLSEMRDERVGWAAPEADDRVRLIGAGLTGGVTVSSTWTYWAIWIQIRCRMQAEPEVVFRQRDDPLQRR